METLIRLARSAAKLTLQCLATHDHALIAIFVFEEVTTCKVGTSLCGFKSLPADESNIMEDSVEDPVERAHIVGFKEKPGDEEPQMYDALVPEGMEFKKPQEDGRSHDRKISRFHERLMGILAQNKHC
ncbi:hypothetical protein M427DRAFT_54468 [Gonapodya prolifera JEL478]|uniref:Uncharacterized protein n=1 Tax=Gonapodya prolifera (strain JEL478) TaxID=1344416 RepID=A0A139ALZ0_GONPJ|nr:hypothetical protein M427DRAFT_54468 [Gonapodya prolifera JEL478]|eukprot:KXS17523.1 hypothetical protein M427DRAFT_54468 [Gonapodya prolifera JEL478]